MRLIFAGTPEFARVALARLVDAGHEIALVLTQPDRPAGRGMKLQASAVKQAALDLQLPVLQPRSLRLDGKFPQDAAQARQAIEQAQAQAMVVAAYGLILPQWVLDTMGRGGADAPALAKFGCLNIHASLLPRWRGAAPIHRAIEAGDTHTGVTIMQMDAGLDTGDMLFMHNTPITARDTTATLHDRLADLGGKLIVLALNEAAAGRLKPVRQPAEGVSYAHKIEKAESLVDWSQPASVIERRIRAFDPFPCASGSLGGEAIKLWKSHVDAMNRPAGAVDGEVLLVNDEGVHVACGDGVLCLTELQRAGAKRLPAADFVRGFPVGQGARFVAPATT